LSIPDSDSGDVLRGKDYAFKATVEIRPSIDLGKINETTLLVEELDFSDEDVEREIERERERTSSLRDVDDRAAQSGDVVNINYQFKQGEDTRNRDNVQVRVGAYLGVLPNEAEDALVGMITEEEKDIEILSKEGETQHFHLKVNSIQERVLPDLDDEMAVDAGFADLADMRAKIRTRLEEEGQKRCKDRAKSRLLQELGEACDVQVPPHFFNNHLDNKVRGMLTQFRMFMQGDKPLFDPDVLRETLRRGAFLEVRNSIILQQAIRDFAVEVEEHELDEALSETAKRQNRSVAYLKSAQSQEDLDELKREIQSRKALDQLFEKVAHQIERLSSDALQKRIEAEKASEAKAEAEEAEKAQTTDADEETASA
jgi:trigger factor